MDKQKLEQEVKELRELVKKAATDNSSDVYMHLSRVLIKKLDELKKVGE